MKKRIVCVLLTLIMLVSLVPATALTASAASLKTSERAITVLKQLEGYEKTCYPDANGKYIIGYGTPCNEKGEHPHTVTEQSVADTAMRKVVAELDTAVNNFASKNGLTLSQNKHDALVLFSYNCGTAWMNGTGVFKSTVVNRATGNEFLNAICLWSNVQGNQSTGLIKRRMIEANMYLNGVYSNEQPANYTYVTFDGNGADLDEGEGYTQYYDTTLSTVPEPVPARSGYVFLGWYVDGENGLEWVPYLTSAHKGETLIAEWQAKDETDTQSHAVSYTLKASQLVSKTFYSSVGGKKWDEETKKYKNATEFAVLYDFIDKDGTRWARIKDTGWVKVGKPKADETTADANIDVTVTVTNSYVNRREKASIYSNKTGSYNQGAQLRIISTATADGFLWGQVAESETSNTSVGWVALMYTNFDAVNDANGSAAVPATGVIAKATVLCTNYVNVRSDAGVNNKIIGALANGNQVDIYEIKTVNGHQWGRTKTGWFCLTYSKLTMLTSNNNTVITDPDVIAYAFTGTMEPTTEIYASAGFNAEIVKTLEEETAVTVTGLKVVGDHTWCKISDGWVILDDITMDVAKYIVTAASVNVRESADSGSEMVDKLIKGVELEISEIQLVNSSIWGYTEKYEDGEGAGWVNLDSKYVSRTNAPSTDTITTTGKVATIIGADSVRVRMNGSLSGKVLGSIALGTTANILDEKNGWYLLDYEVDDNPETGSWVYGQYVSVSKGTVSSGSTGSTSSSSGTGTGIIANTYSGVNVRSNPGTGNALLGKVLTGTQVNILKVTTSGTAKWGYIEAPLAGWICMDYVAMISYEDIPGYNGSTGTGNGGTTVGSYDDCVSSATTAIYTGTANQDSIVVRKDKDQSSDVVRELNYGDNVTVQELLAVTRTIVKNEDEDYDADSSDVDTDTLETVTETIYWARVNDGYIINPQKNLTLDALDEETYTVTGIDKLKLYDAAAGNEIKDLTLAKGDKVTVTKLQIVKDKVWGRIETAAGKIAWARLDYMSEGAIYVSQNSNTNTGSNNTNTGSTTPTTPTVGSTGNTGAAGNGTYLYTGKVINTNSLNVRATASTTATISTTLKNGAALVIYETVISEYMAWGRCDAGWVYLYYVDMTPVNGAVDARVVYNDNTTIYTDVNCTEVAGSYSKMAVIDIYEIVGKMARTDQGWVNTDNLL